jgi:hypothetical protein
MSTRAAPARRRRLVGVAAGHEVLIRSAATRLGDQLEAVSGDAQVELHLKHRREPSQRPKRGCVLAGLKPDDDGTTTATNTMASANKSTTPKVPPASSTVASSPAPAAPTVSLPPSHDRVLEDHYGEVQKQPGLGSWLGALQVASAK